MPKPKSLTVTVYDVQREVEGRRYRCQYATTPEYFDPAEYDVTPLIRTFELDQTVKVRAFGAWRIGAVVKLGRSLVTVDYYRNREGDRHVRTFAASEVMPLEEWNLGDREFGRLPAKSNPAAVAKLTAERQAADEAIELAGPTEMEWASDQDHDEDEAVELGEYEPEESVGPLVARAEADVATRLEYAGREGTGLCPSQISGRHCWDRNDPTFCLACRQTIE